MYSIYVHRDPRTYVVRYVGFTGDLYRRFPQHLARREHNQKKNAWLNELHGLGLMPVQEVIDLADTVEEARQKEAFWISFFDRTQLTNLSFPRSTIPEPTERWPALIELEVPLEHLSHIVTKHIVPELAFRYGNDVDVIYLCSDKGRAVIQCMARYPVNLGLFLFVNSRYLLQHRVIMAYRYKLRGSSWATFGLPSPFFKKDMHYRYPCVCGDGYLEELKARAALGT